MMRCSLAPAVINRMFSILTRRPGARFWREHEFLYDADKQMTKATSLWNNEGPRPRVLTIRFQDFPLH